MSEYGSDAYSTAEVDSTHMPCMPGEWPTQELPAVGSQLLVENESECADMEAMEHTRCFVIAGCDETHLYRYHATLRMISKEENHDENLPTEAGEDPDAVMDHAHNTAASILQKFIGVRCGKRNKHWIRRYIQKVRAFCKVGNHSKRFTKKVNSYTKKDTGIYYPMNDANMSD